jgi:hypothetical protein
MHHQIQQRTTYTTVYNKRGVAVAKTVNKVLVTGMHDAPDAWDLAAKVDKLTPEWTKAHGGGSREDLYPSEKLTLIRWACTDAHLARDCGPDFNDVIESASIQLVQAN